MSTRRQYAWSSQKLCCLFVLIRSYRSHSVNLVCIAGQTYLVDVGFGGKHPQIKIALPLIRGSGNGPTRPMPLIHGLVLSWGATRTELRLVYRSPTNPVVQGVWTFESRISREHDWMPNYCFGLTEFTPQDFEVMNYATSTRRTSWFTFVTGLFLFLMPRAPYYIGWEPETRSRLSLTRRNMLLIR
jgi:arylamine N-acetyltransferase